MTKSERPTTLVDLALLVGIAWMWLSIYDSFTRTGLWRVLASAVGGATTLPSELAVLALCVLAGWIVVAAACWSAWWLMVRGRASGDFPAARLVRQR